MNLSFSYRSPEACRNYEKTSGNLKKNPRNFFQKLSNFNEIIVKYLLIFESW